MVNKLVVIAICGITLSGVCLGAGGAMEGRNFRKDFPDGGLISLFNDRPRCEAGTATAGSRTLDWDGSDSVSLRVPGHVLYTPGSDDRLHVSGDPQLVAHVRVRDGRVELDCRNWRGDTEGFTVTLPGREFHKFGIAGSGNLTLNRLNQDELNLSIAGSGSIKADGRLGSADLHIAGSGDINAAQVNAQVVKVHIAGSGNTDIAPTEEADIHIAGSGDVNLRSNPKKLETHIAGSGRIHNIAPGG
jgi:putative autotransporter adhesin-like protein